MCLKTDHLAVITYDQQYLQLRVRILILSDISVNGLEMLIGHCFEVQHFSLKVSVKSTLMELGMHKFQFQFQFRPTPGIGIQIAPQSLNMTWSWSQ